MILREQDIKELEKVPAGKWHELMDFVRFLTESAKADRMRVNKPVRHGEWVEGEIWMSDDFNDPLEFVSPEEMKVLEAVRESKKQEIQEAAV